MTETHSERIARMRRDYAAAHARLVTRLSGASDEAVAGVPADGGWSAAQIGWHVAAVDATFAGLISGAVPGAKPLPDGVAARPWPEIAAAIPEKLEAGARVQPPEAPARQAVLDALADAAARLDAALAGLSEERAIGYGITHPVIGTVALAHVGDWATAHTIRHNAQAKRRLG